jgi:RNA polymerase sigma-70 factor (ECF subfamily)
MPTSAAALQILSSGLSDLELAQRIATGDEIAFEALMRRYNRPLYRTARAILRDDAEAEDALQVAYLNAYRAFGEFRGQSRLSTWLTRIVVNEALTRARKRGRESAVIPLDGFTGDEGDTMAGVADQNMRDQPERAAMRMQARTLIESKIDALPDAFRTVFVLRAVEELSVEETAICLEIPEATVRTRFFRARSLLRESLAREIDFAVDDAFSFAGARCDRIVTRVLQRLLRPPDTT